MSAEGSETRDDDMPELGRARREQLRWSLSDEVRVQAWVWV